MKGNVSVVLLAVLGAACTHLPESAVVYPEVNDRLDYVVDARDAEKLQRDTVRTMRTDTYYQDDGVFSPSPIYLLDDRLGERVGGRLGEDRVSIENIRCGHIRSSDKQMQSAGIPDLKGIFSAPTVKCKVFGTFREEGVYAESREPRDMNNRAEQLRRLLDAAIEEFISDLEQRIGR